jgi:AraC-like DNA-binding protein
LSGELQGSDQTHSEDESLSGMYRAAVGDGGTTLAAAFAALRSGTSAGAARQESPVGLFARTPNPFGLGYWDTYLFDDASVIVSRCDYASERREMSYAEGFVEFHFSLSGNAELQDSSHAEFPVEPPSMLICEQGPNACYGVRCESGLRISVSIYIRPDVLLSEFDLSSQTAQQRPGAGEIALQFISMTADLADLASKLAGATLEGERRLHFANGLTRAMLSLATAAWDARDAQTPEILTARDIKLFERARQIIVDSADKPLTIAALARLLGTNETKLKSGFKLMYGVTIFDFGQARRMQKAFAMLTQDRQTVGEVARALGYSHQASFGSSFKKHFGITPSAARKVRCPEPLCAPS